MGNSIGSFWLQGELIRPSTASDVSVPTGAPIGILSPGTEGDKRGELDVADGQFEAADEVRRRLGSVIDYLDGK